MPAPRKYDQETRDRAVRMYQERRRDFPDEALRTSRRRVGEVLDVNPETMRGWIKQIEAAEQAAPPGGALMPPKTRSFPPITAQLEIDLEQGYYIFAPPPLPAKTPRSSLELLSQPLVFSQDSLLDVGDLLKRAERRRIKLDRALLEDLHRNRLLVPLFRIRRDNPRPQNAVEVAQPEWVGRWNRLDPLIARAAAEGRLTDPASERFYRWERDRPPELEPADLDTTSKFMFLYSPYQLLTLEALRDVIDRHVPVWRGRDSAKRLDPRFHKRDDAAEIMDSWRSLAIALHALDTRYGPILMRQVIRFETWRHYVEVFEPKRVLEWLELSEEDLRKLAERLRRSGSRLDPTGDFFDLVRRAQPQKWSSLEGDAALSMDYRQAGELFEMFADDLAGRGVRPELPQNPRRRPVVRDQRLMDRPGSLDGALTSLNLSPYPSLVLGVEGETEETIVPRVFELLDYPLESSWIHLERYGGVGKDLQLLARHVSRPYLGEDYGEFAVLDRPLTRLLILVDAEGKHGHCYITHQDREKERRKLLKEILTDVEPRFRRDLRRPEAQLVTIRAWNKYPFEFAHFSDRELADGLIEMAGCIPPDGRAWLLAEVERERRRHKPRNGRSADIEKVWKLWSPAAPFRKHTFASAMWPKLAGKIHRSLANYNAPLPPVLKNVRLAIELALLPHRMNMALASSEYRKRKGT